MFDNDLANVNLPIATALFMAILSEIVSFLLCLECFVPKLQLWVVSAHNVCTKFVSFAEQSSGGYSPALCLLCSVLLLTYTWLCAMSMSSVVKCLSF